MAEAGSEPRVPFNDLSRALRREREVLTKAMRRVISSGWLVHGPEHAAFESELAAYLGTSAAYGVASGTDALEIALRAVVTGGRTTVVTAANCGGYTTTAAKRAGLQVAYVDVDEATHLIAPDTIAPLLDNSVGAVVVTHLYGRAADISTIRAACAPYGIPVVEDCAQAIGARVKNSRVGSLAEAAAFSFYPTKNLGALGDGGAVATSDPEIAARVERLRQYGWSEKYVVVTDGGRNSRLDEIQAAVLRVRLANLEVGNERRRSIIGYYADVASGRMRVLPVDGPQHVGHLAVVTTASRDALRMHLSERGIGHDIHYPIPDHRQPAWAAEYTRLRLPVTERLADAVLSVPSFPELTDREVERVGDALATF